MSSLLLGERVIDLRHLLQINQGELANSIDIAQAYISRIEKGTRPLTPDIASRLALRHEVPLSFFSAEDPIPNYAAPTFRKKASTLVRESNLVEALQKTALRLFHVASLESDYRAWEHPLPEMTTDPEEAAALVRSFFGLDEVSPVRNVTRLLERSGVGVISRLAPDPDEELVKRYHGVTKPSMSDSRPLVALFDSGRGDVNRLTTAHELGHLLFDRVPDGLTVKQREERAFRFAAAFLLPPAAVRDWIAPDLPLSGYLAIKAKYGVSASATIRRGRDLGLISPERYRSLMIQHSSRGWRMNEPGSVELERPLLLTQAISRAWPENTLSRAASAAGAPKVLVRTWTGGNLPTVKSAPVRPSNVVDFAEARRALKR